MDNAEIKENSSSAVKSPVNAMYINSIIFLWKMFNPALISIIEEERSIMPVARITWLEIDLIKLKSEVIEAVIDSKRLKFIFAEVWSQNVSTLVNSSRKVESNKARLNVVSLETRVKMFITKEIEAKVAPDVKVQFLGKICYRQSYSISWRPSINLYKIHLSFYCV